MECQNIPAEFQHRFMTVIAYELDSMKKKTFLLFVQVTTQKLHTALQYLTTFAMEWPCENTLLILEYQKMETPF